VSALASIIIAWAGMQTWIAGYSGLMYVQRRTSPEHLSYAILSFGLALYCLGAAFMTDAPSVAEGTDAMRVSYVGAALVGGSLVSLCCQLAGLPPSRLQRIAWAWAAVGLGANLAGFFFDGAIASAPGVAGLDFAPRYQEPQMLAPGVIWVAGATVLTAIAVNRLRRKLRTNPELRPFFTAGTVAVLAVVHDLGTHVVGLRSVYLFEHAAVLATLVVSQILLGRFVAASEELDRRTHELEESHQALQKVQEELVRTRQLATVGELAAVVALEVRHPLGHLMDAVNGLKAEGLDAVDRSTLLNALDVETERLNWLVRDLLSYARPIRPQPQSVHVGDLIQQALEGASDDWDDVEVDVDLAGAPPLVHGDPDLLLHGLANVLLNARQAMDRGGELTVRAAEDELEGQAAVRLTVTDTGEGMDTVVRAKATAPFFTTRTFGTGLGLAIVERVVEAHGGTMEIQSRYGAGTEVTLRLPVHRVSTIPPEAAARGRAIPGKT